MRRIDIHTHFHCLDYVKHLYGRDAFPRTVRDGGTYVVQCAPAFGIPALPPLLDMEEKLRDADTARVAVSVLSHGLVLGPDALGGNEADDWANRINDALARIIQTYPGKFLGLGTIGFGSAKRSIAEVDRCVDELRLSGFQLYSNVAGKMLAAPEFRTVLQHIAARGVPVHLHPAIPLNRIGLETAGDHLGLGFPYDTTLSVLHLIQSGFFDEAPDFQLIVAHTGGLIPYLKGRLEVYSTPSPLIVAPPKLVHPLAHYLDNLYVDTVCYHQAALDCCFQVLGAEHLLYGTDHPFGDYDRAAELVEQLDCSPAERELIYHGNAERLLNCR